MQDSGDRLLGRLATAVDWMTKTSFHSVATWQAAQYDAWNLPVETVEKLVWQAEAIVARES